MNEQTFLTYSLGCRVNQAEIEKISQGLIESGFVPWSETPINPDLVLINTCAVTQKAEKETRQTIKKFRRLYPETFLVVLGCGVNIHQKLKTNLPEVDLLIPNEEKSQAIGLITKSYPSSESRARRGKNREGCLQTISPYLSSGRKLIKIQDGCNKYCTFCIVPHLRGQPKNRSANEIIKTIQQFNHLTIQEIILTGINLSFYGKNLKPQTTLTRLLERILEETNIARISLSSLTPTTIAKDFTNLYLNHHRHPEPTSRHAEFSSASRLSAYWHLAIQSGSPKILEKMGRKTDLGALLKSIQLIKKQIPDFVFRSDFLVGFPGETEKDFQQTLHFIKQAQISFVHVFPFSKRPNTTAFKMIEKGTWQDLPPQIKKERVKQVMTTTQKVRKTEAEKLVGKTLPCLFINKKDNYWRTMANNSWPVHIPLKTIQPSNHLAMSKDLKSKILTIKINEAKRSYLLGNILSFPTYSLNTLGITTDPSSC